MKYGRYEVVSEIGRGSMGVVYQAHDPQIDRLVALKVLRQDRVSSEDYVKRFLKEATAVGRLSHRGIVTVFDIGQDHGTIYIAMELLEGTPLDELMKQQKIGFDLIFRIGKDVAEALHYAHQKGIVHRDIKPANIICSENGEVKVTDFGIAHIEDPDGQQMTQAGEILGTPVYMSPEQVLGQPVDGRSDIYSLGVILYEMTTGRRPFKAGNLAALFQSITGDPVTSPTSIDPEIPERFSTLIMRAMAREPADRPSSGEKLIGEIDDAMGGAVSVSMQSADTSDKSSTPGTPNTSAKIWTITVLGFFLCAGVGGLYYLDYFPAVSTISKKFKTSKTIAVDEKAQEEQIESEADISSVVSPTEKDDEGIEHISQTKEKKKIDTEIVSKTTPSKERTVTIETKGESQQKTIPEVGEKDAVLDTAPDIDTGIFSNPAFTEKKPSEEPIIQKHSQSPREPDTKGATAGIQKETKYDSFPEGWKLKEDKSLSASVPLEPTRTIKIDQKTVPIKPIEPPVEKTTGISDVDGVQAQQKKEIVVASLPPAKESIQPMATLKMNSRPKGASIYVDGDYIGKTPFEFEVSAVKHELMLQLQGHGDWKAQLDLRKGGKVPLSIRLRPE